jgi:hypothetical protein
MSALLIDGKPVGKWRELIRQQQAARRAQSWGRHRRKTAPMGPAFNPARRVPNHSHPSPAIPPQKAEVEEAAS